MSKNSATGNGGAIWLGALSSPGTMAAACFTGNTAIKGGAIFYDGNSFLYPLLLLRGLQSFGGNQAKQEGNALYLGDNNGGAQLACAKDPNDADPRVFDVGPYDVEGFICTDYASSPPANYCPAGSPTCTCPASYVFSTSQCACQVSRSISSNQPTGTCSCAAGGLHQLLCYRYDQSATASTCYTVLMRPSLTSLAAYPIQFSAFMCWLKLAPSCMYC